MMQLDLFRNLPFHRRSFTKIEFTITYYILDTVFGQAREVIIEEMESYVIASLPATAAATISASKSFSNSRDLTSVAPGASPDSRYGT